MPLPFEGIAPSCDGDGDDSQCTQISDGALVGGSSESTLALTTASGQVVIIDLNADDTSSFAAGGGAPLRGFGAGRVGVAGTLLVWGGRRQHHRALGLARRRHALHALEARAPSSPARRARRRGRPRPRRRHLGKHLVAFAAPACAADAADAAPPSELAQWRVAGVTGALSVRPCRTNATTTPPKADSTSRAFPPCAARPPPCRRRPPRAIPGAVT